MKTLARLVDSLFALTKPALFRLDAESVHEVVIAALSRCSERSIGISAIRRLAPEPDARLSTEIFRQVVPFPLGVAAGFDKNGTSFPALLALGFGFAEVGTVTPVDQEGNPRPRVFRLPQDDALINRMGFPGNGVEIVVNSLVRLRQLGRLVGCNIGPNWETVERGDVIRDYVRAYHRLAPYCSYVAINVSSPNTPRLRRLQSREHLTEILAAIADERRSAWKPLLVKISPDLTETEIAEVLDACTLMDVDGVIATNTTTSRTAALRSVGAYEAGGLSGRPLASMASKTITFIHREIGESLPVIAAGGIFTGLDVLGAIASGASLTQTYTGFIYRGPMMAARVQDEMLAAMDRWGVRRLEDLRGNPLPS
jgi:dihydroorotate dehydrogenase